LNYGKNMMAALVRVLMKRMPPWLWKRIILNKHLARPQASFLPQVRDDVKLKAMPQPSLIKTLPILKKIVDDPDVLCIDSPEVLAKATALKDVEEKRASAAIEAGLVVHTPVPSSRVDINASEGPIAV
ncbi:hypothetical protein BG004_002700, partial [Podila humilis]